METTTTTPAPSALLRAGSLPIFLAVAFGGAWLVALPLWLSGGGVESPMLATTAAAMMFTPSLGLLVTWLVARRRGVTLRTLARETGLGLGPRKRRTFAVVGALWLGTPLFIALSVLASAAVGLYELDLGGLGLFTETMRDLPGGDGSLSPQQLALLMLVTLPLNPLINAVFSLGEEWGWRGFLMPRLLPHGRAKAIIASGVIWGLWHAPLTLLGYNYELLGAWAALAFVPFCVVFGAVLSWSRLVTGSVWPAVIGHGALNGSTVLVLLAGASGQQPNLALAGPIGVVGVLLLAVIAALLFVKRPGNVGFRPGDAALDGR